MKVLIVDDDRFVRQGLRKLLPWKEIGCEIVEEASEGESAWTLIQSLKPDLVITDIRMPGVDGLELARRISESTSGIRIIMLSAYADFEYAQSAVKFHVRHYLLKPISEEKLKQLTEHIRSIADEIRKERRYYELRFLDGGDKQRIAKALKCADIGEIEVFFERDVPSFGLHGGDLRVYCMDLIALLFQYLHNLGLQKDAADRSKRTAVHTVSSLKNERDILDYTYQLYQDTLQFSLQKMSKSNKLAFAIFQYVTKHCFDENLSVATIAQEFHLSSVYAGALFRMQEGTNLNQFVLSRRMEKAAILLRDPTLRVQDISKMVGYTDPQYFGKIFKKFYSITPTEFRRITMTSSEDL